MTTSEAQYSEQLRMLKERFPQADDKKLNRLLQRHDGNVEQVGARLAHRATRANRIDALEARFGAVLDTVQQEYPAMQSMKRARILRAVERHGGDADQVRKFAQKVEARHHREGQDARPTRQERREELKTKYAGQLAELAKNGVNVDKPCTLRMLEKHQGDVNKVLEIVSRRNEKRQKVGELSTKYADEIAQLKTDGVAIKNERVLARLLEKGNGDVSAVKQLISEREEKHLRRREYRHKHRCRSPKTTEQGESACGSRWKRHLNYSDDDLDTLKNMRAAGVHGNPKKLLALHRECGGSMDMLRARLAEQRDERSRDRAERQRKHHLLADARSAYITVNYRDDWPRDVEHVYLDGNNMMFVVNSLRRLCLNRAGHRTERALGEVAAAWNEQMHIPNIDLIFDSTHQLDAIGTVKVSSARPKYPTTDDMLVEIARRPENREKNKRTVVVTSDRELGALLQREGCQLMKPYNWFAHCVMVLTPDLIQHEEVTGMTAAASSPTAVKVRYNFDELVHRIANIDI